MKASERKDAVYEFCTQHIPGFSRARFYKMINKALAYASKKSNCFVVVDKVDIFQGEVDYINSLELPPDYKKCMFAFLVQMRLNKIVYEKKNKKEYSSTYFKGGMQKYARIKKMANVSQKLNITSGFLRDIAANGLIQVLHNGLINLTYLENCKQSGDVVIEVKDYEDVGWYLDEYNNVKGIVRCKYSDHPFKQTKHDITYCAKHKEYYKPEETRVGMCSDCGEEFTVDARNTTKVRCQKCQHERDKARKREWWSNKN
jgi:hypothetical protein